MCTAKLRLTTTCLLRTAGKLICRKHRWRCCSGPARSPRMSSSHSRSGSARQDIALACMRALTCSYPAAQGRMRQRSLHPPQHANGLAGNRRTLWRPLPRRCRNHIRSMRQLSSDRPLQPGCGGPLHIQRSCPVLRRPGTGRSRTADTLWKTPQHCSIPLRTSCSRPH